MLFILIISELKIFSLLHVDHHIELGFHVEIVDYILIQWKVGYTNSGLLSEHQDIRNVLDCVVELSINLPLHEVTSNGPSFAVMLYHPSMQLLLDSPSASATHEPCGILVTSFEFQRQPPPAILLKSSFASHACCHPCIVVLT